MNSDDPRYDYPEENYFDAEPVEVEYNADEDERYGNRGSTDA
jgi:hypothetical protein